MKRSHLACLAAATALLAGALGDPGLAHAQSSEADRLFRQGLSLFARGQLGAACDKFSASYAIDPAAGTLFNLASCHERTEHWAEAHREFLELAARATASGASDKAQQARGRAQAVEVHLPRLALHGAREHGFDAVTVDGKDVPPADWTSPLVVTVGEHVVEARAAGKSTARLTVTARAETETPVDLGAASVEAEAPAPPVATPTVSAIPQERSSPWRTVGWISGGAGVVLLAGGAYFGAKAFSNKHDADDACQAVTARVCPTIGKTTEAQNSLNTAYSDATLSTVGLIVGAAALGAGAYLVLRPSPSSSSSAASLRLAPLVGREGGGATLAGTF